MFNLRQTWNDVFPNTKLYALDVKVNVLDPNWPITAKVAPSNTPATIHVNPNFFKPKAGPIVNDEIQKQLKDKERELLELQKRKLELELMATQKKLEEKEKEMVSFFRALLMARIIISIFSLIFRERN
jgi:pre-mRNA cleavage complex 2 protein Pcf11